MTRNIHIPSLAISLFLLLSIGCKQNPPEVKPPELYQLNIPDHFPDVPIPDDNPLTVDKVKLGKKLFYDPILSLDNTISCASCHLADNGFADPRRLSFGVDNTRGKRNSMALINLAYAQSFFWDGANPTLEDQAIHPIISEIEMKGDPATIEERLKAHAEYPDLFTEAFDAPPSMSTIIDALACFERTMISANAPYDKYVQGDTSALTPSQVRGMLLFETEQAECFHCHAGYNFTDGSFQNNGLYNTYEDPGRMDITGNSRDAGKFKVPTLRNIEYTAPYMHDGNFKTLEQVMDHYARGGSDHPNKNLFIGNINLSEQDKQDLINFLKALSDEEFINNPEFRK